MRGASSVDAVFLGHRALVAAATLITVAAVTTPSARTANLAHGLGGDGTNAKGRRHLVPAGGSFADLALRRARANFFAIEVSKLDPGSFQSFVTQAAHTYKARANRGAKNGPRGTVAATAPAATTTASTPTRSADESSDLHERAREHLIQCALGECDAFVSHAHVDEHYHPGEKYAALKAWGEEHKAPPLVWVDGICLTTRDVSRTLPLLPIFVVSCKQFLALAGSRYTSRLWTVMEMFTFVQSGFNPAGSLRVLPLGRVSPASLLTTFDVRNATCAVARDYDALIAIVEASFGDLRAFNRVMRTLPLGGPGGGAPERDGAAPVANAA